MLVPVSEIILMIGKLMRKDFANVGGNKIRMLIIIIIILVPT